MRIDSSTFAGTPVWVIVTTENGHRVHRVVAKEKTPPRWRGLSS